MMLRHSFDMEKEAAAIENALEAVLDKGYRTHDIAPPGTPKTSCSQMGNLIADSI